MIRRHTTLLRPGAGRRWPGNCFAAGRIIHHHHQRGLATISCSRRPRSPSPDGACIFLPDPALDSRCCRPIWADSVDPAVLRVRCEPCDASSPFAFNWPAFQARASVARDRQYLLVGAGTASIRLDVVAGSALDGPVQLEPAIAFDRDLDRQLAAVCRLHAMLGGASPSAERDARLPRLVLALRALDARAEGASLREIATILLDEPDWPGGGEWMKSWVRRIIKLAGKLVEAGPRGVLRRTV